MRIQAKKILAHKRGKVNEGVGLQTFRFEK